MSQKTLLTGSSGLLGSRLYPYLKEHGFDVVGHGYTANSDVCCDLRCRESTRKLLDNVKPELIINLVALTNVDKCEQEPQSAYLLNVRVVENLVEWIRSHSSVRFVQISTDQIYDGKGPHSEDEVTLQNTYAFSKYCGEIAARQVESTILRTNFFGHSSHPSRRSFSDWLIDSFENQLPIKLFTDVLFSPLSLDSLVEILAQIIEKPIGGVFNLGSWEGMSKRDFALGLASHLSLKTKCAKDCLLTENKLAARRPLDMRMDCRLFERMFGISLPLLADEIKRLKKIS